MMIIMVNNLSFLHHKHFCKHCKKEINMLRVAKFIYTALNKYTPTVEPNDPVIIEDHGNDLELVCNYECAKKYYFANWGLDFSL